MADTHYFKIEHAQEYGIAEAVLLSHFDIILTANRANNRNYYEGLWWTYNTASAYSDIFPYLSSSKIRRVLEHLEDEGLIVTGNFNKVKFDRTKWYALTEKGWELFGKKIKKQEKAICNSENSILQNEQMRIEQNVEMRTCQNDGTIPGDDRLYQEKNKRERRFTPPTREEAQAYADEKGYTNFDVDHFMAYYESNGWRVGKNPMKSWRAAITSWVKREESYNKKSTTTPRQTRDPNNGAYLDHSMNDKFAKYLEDGRKKAEAMRNGTYWTTENN